MSVVEQPRSAGLIARVRGILMKPAAEWDVIDGESATIPGLFTGYACILAAIAPICMVLQHLLFVSPFLHWTLPLSIGIAVMSYVASLAGVFIVGFIIDALAPSFDAQKNPVQAMKLAVYSNTAAWVGGIFGLIPILGILAIVAAIYGLYIFWLGVPKIMKAPQEKATGYAVVVVIVAIVVEAIIFAIIGAFTASMMASAIMTGAMLH